MSKAHSSIPFSLSSLHLQTQVAKDFRRTKWNRLRQPTRSADQPESLPTAINCGLIFLCAPPTQKPVATWTSHQNRLAMPDDDAPAKPHTKANWIPPPSPTHRLRKHLGKHGPSGRCKKRAHLPTSLDTEPSCQHTVSISQNSAHLAHPI